MSALKGRKPTAEEIEQMNKRAPKKKRAPRGAYVTAVKNWYYETAEPCWVFDVTEERSGSSLFAGLKNAVRRLRLKGKVKVHPFKRGDTDRVYLERLK